MNGLRSEADSWLFINPNEDNHFERWNGIFLVT